MYLPKGAGDFAPMVLRSGGIPLDVSLGAGSGLGTRGSPLPRGRRSRAVIRHMGLDNAVGESESEEPYSAGTRLIE